MAKTTLVQNETTPTQLNITQLAADGYATAGTQDGDPILADDINDYKGFASAVLSDNSITASGNPDTQAESQVYQGLNKKFDQIRYKTLSEATSEDAAINTKYVITDLGSARYDVVASTDTGGFYIATMTSGRKLRLTSKGRVSIEAFGAKENQDSSTAIRSAVAYGPCSVPPKRYIYDGVDITTDNVDIVGVSRPFLAINKQSLQGGSIIQGTFRLKGSNPRVERIGIDHGFDAFGATGGDALVIAHSTPNTQSMAVAKDIIGLCTEVESPYHAILVEGHTDTDISSIIGVYGFFGCALKNTRNNVDGFIGIENGSDNIIIKSDTVSGTAKDVNLTNIVCLGAGNAVSPNTGFNIRIISFDEDCDNINISNVVGSKASNGLYVDSRATGAKSINALHLNNLNFRDVATGVLVDGGTGTGVINDLQMSNISVIGAVARAAEIKGKVRSLKVNGFYGSLLASSSYKDTAFTVDSNVRSVMIDDLELVEANDFNTKVTLNIDANYPDVQLGKVKAHLKGAGKPRPGFSQPTDTGSDITLSPEFNCDKWSSFIAMKPTAITSVNEINRLLSSGDRFPYGYKLTILNDSNYNITIKHNGAGFIWNTGATDVVLATNEAVSYVFYNAVWHQC